MQNGKTCLIEKGLLAYIALSKYHRTFAYLLNTPIFKFSNVRSLAFRRNLAEVLPPEGGTPNDWQKPDYLKIAVLNSPHFKFLEYLAKVLSSNAERTWQTACEASRFWR